MQYACPKHTMTTWRCSCGAFNDGGFCSQCGQVHAAPKIPPPFSGIQQPQSNEAAIKRTAIAVVVVIAIVVFFFAARQKESPQAPISPNAPPPVRTSNPEPEPERAIGHPADDAPPNPAQPLRLTELRGSLARRREDDLWLITNVFGIVNSRSSQERILRYCMTTVYGAEDSKDSSPVREYALQADGTVLVRSGKPPKPPQLPKTPEQRFREEQRRQFEIERLFSSMQDCGNKLYTFGTWNDQPMPTAEKFAERLAQAKGDLEEIDNLLDSHLVKRLPKPNLDTAMKTNYSVRSCGEKLPDLLMTFCSDVPHFASSPDGTAPAPPQTGSAPAPAPGPIVPAPAPPRQPLNGVGVRVRECCMQRSSWSTGKRFSRISPAAG